MAVPTPDDLPIFVAWLDFVAWLLPTTARLPKSQRFTFSQRIDNLALDVVEDLVEARYTRHKQAILKRANLRLEKLRVLLRLCHQAGHLAPRHYEHAMRRLYEVGQMLGGWQRQQEEPS